MRELEQLKVLEEKAKNDLISSVIWIVAMILTTIFNIVSMILRCVKIMNPPEDFNLGGALALVVVATFAATCGLIALVLWSIRAYTSRENLNLIRLKMSMIKDNLK